MVAWLIDNGADGDHEDHADARDHDRASPHGPQAGAPPLGLVTRMATDDTPRLGRSVSIDKAAAALCVSRRTVYNRIKDGRLQTIRTLGGSQRVLVESVDLMVRGVRADPCSESKRAGRRPCVVPVGGTRHHIS